MKKFKNALLALAATVIMAAPSTAQQFGPSLVSVAEAEARIMAPTQDVPGTVISLNNSAISAEVEGPITWLADVGTAVTKGDVIAKLDARKLTIARRRAEANLKRLEADLVYKDSEVQRYEELASRDVASRSRLDSAIADRDMTREQINDAKASLDLAKGDEARTQIRAPFDGHVVQRIANVGEYLMVGNEVIRLVDTGNLEIAIAAPIESARALSEGMEVAVRANEETVMTPIRAVVPVGEVQSRMLEVRLAVERGKWIAGTPVTVILPKSVPQEMIAVPRDSLVLKGSTFFVFTVGEDNTATRHRVEPQAAIGTWVGITGGVKAGDTVVIRGAERLQPGGAVQIQ